MSATPPVPAVVAQTLTMLTLACLIQPSDRALADTGPEDPSWAERKCVLYRQAWHDAVHAVGAQNLSAEFTALNDRFIASGCAERVNLCPATDAEVDLANLLTVLTMNEGMASTFVPFSCGTD